MYLNEIYYGNLAYGIEAAARTYFAKPASALTLGESSLLAGLPQSPVDLDPFTNLEGAKERQWLILNLMVSEGYIDQAAAEAAYLEPLTFAAQEVSLEAPHFAVYVRQHSGRAIRRGDGGQWRPAGDDDAGHELPAAGRRSGPAARRAG
jgi:membrane peptidoglycan carboxypeptidase